MNQYSFLEENSRTDFLLKHPLARKIYSGILHFTGSKYAFPIVMHSYGWATITLPSGSVYTIALGSIPRKMRKEVLYKLRHSKNTKDALNVINDLKNQGINVIKNLKEKITDTVERMVVPKQPNLIKYSYIHNS